jgi:trimeric autotransporter adhesin
MLKLSGNQIVLAASALLMCAGFAQAQTASPLTASPTSVSVTYSLASSTAGTAVPVTLTIASGTGDAFVVDPTTVPIWLTLTAMSGTAVPKSPGPAVVVSFNASAGAGTLNPGAYYANVSIDVTGFNPLVVPVSLVVSAAPSVLSVYNGSTQLAVTSPGSVPLTYTYGSTTYPTATINLFSSNDPIAYTLTSATTVPAATVDWIQLSASSGLATSYGSASSFTITFLPAVFQAASVGQTLTGSVTISYGTSSTYVINITIPVSEPNAAVTGIYPQEVAPHTSGSVTVVVSGSGFGNTGGYSGNPTVVSLTYGSTPVTNTMAAVNGTVTFVNSNTMVLKIPFEDASDAPILAAGTVTISATNGLSGEVAQTAVLNVTASPIIYSVADAAALVEPAPGATASVAPYEIVSIFGANFCPTCTGPVSATLTSNRYPTTLTAGGHALTVTFYQADGSTLVGAAYILFATNTQINAIVPSVVAGVDNMQVIVSYDSLPSNANVVYSANAVTAHPGIFTISSSGQGQGAVLLSPANSVNSATNEAAIGGTVLIYLSGMGAPTSVATDAAPGTPPAHYPASCISTAAYVTAADLTSPATADGAVLQSTDIEANLLPPCFATAPTVSIGGKPATVTYAGWVSDSVAGLYQINATVPTGATAGAAVPVSVTVGGVTSQAGVTMAVK